ncbi:MAG TPA: dipeptidase [Bryobacterales bacterium]|nr:dipeptidase [Bryobacterales bacterium]
MLTRRRFGAATLGAASSLLSQSACSSDESAGTQSTDPVASGPSLLERSIILDLHCDTPMLITDEAYDLGRRHDYGEVDIPRMREGGISGVFFSIYTTVSQSPESAKQRSFEIIEAVVAEVARHPGDLILGRRSDDILRAKQENKIAIFMGLEGGHTIDSDLDVLRSQFEKGICYMTLTHSANTPWAGSSGDEDRSKGLTEFGREVVREMNRLGMMVDISHVSDQTFFDAVEATKAPLIASHSSCRALSNHPRNMTDEMIQALAKNGGVIHINFYNEFLDARHRVYAPEYNDLSEKAAAVRKKFADDAKQRSIELRKLDLERLARTGRVPFEHLLDHFEHAAKIAGPDHVGLGSDFDGVSAQTPEGMEDISHVPRLIDGLRERGFSDDDISKILGGNTLRVMKAVEQAAHA